MDKKKPSVCSGMALELVQKLNHKDAHIYMFFDDHYKNGIYKIKKKITLEKYEKFKYNIFRGHGQGKNLFYQNDPFNKITYELELLQGYKIKNHWTNNLGCHCAVFFNGFLIDPTCCKAYKKYNHNEEPIVNLI